MMKSRYNFLKQIHVYLFLFMLCELAYGGIVFNPVLSQVRKVALLLGLIYMFFYFGQLPIYMRLVLAAMVGMVLHLCYESMYRYGTWFESINFVSQLFFPAIVVGSFVACIWLRDVNIGRIANLVIVFYVINQFLLGRISLHHFNSEERSMTAAEAYFLIVPMIYYLNVFLLNNQKNYLYYFLAVFVVAILCFHRTVWIVSIVSIILNLYLVRQYTRVKIGMAMAQLTPLLVSAFILFSLLLYAKPDLVESISSSLSDIENSDKQGTGGWRAEQRDIYLALVPEHPFLGWTYEGYDRGEVMAGDATEEWTNVKGTFIHSTYVYALYNFGVVGLLMKLSIIFFSTVRLYRLFNRQDPGHWMLLIFINSGWIFAWSYQLPEFYWAFIGIAIFVSYREELASRWSRNPKNQQFILDSQLV